MKVIENIFILLCLLLYCVTKSFDYFGVEQGYFVKNHLADLLCMPLVFYFIRWIIQRIKPFKKGENLPILAVLLVTVYWSFYFEYYLPATSDTYIGDSTDVLMYFFGTALYLLITRKKTRSIFARV